MKKKFKDFTPLDFPEVDPIKFEEWKLAYAQMKEDMVIVFLIFLIINIVLYIVSGNYIFGLILLLLAVSGVMVNFIHRSKKLGISGSIIKKVLIY